MIMPAHSHYQLQITILKDAQALSSQLLCMNLFIQDKRKDAFSPRLLLLPQNNQCPTVPCKIVINDVSDVDCLSDEIDRLKILFGKYMSQNNNHFFPLSFLEYRPKPLGETKQGSVLTYLGEAICDQVWRVDESFNTVHNTCFGSRIQLRSYFIHTFIPASVSYIVNMTLKFHFLLFC